MVATPRKMFISHSSKDEKVVKAFVNLMYNLIPQNSKRMHDSEKGANPTVTASKCKA